ncbi:G2/mitotic-specific cyclin-B3 [Erinaceus europaeus]|uniref:G2/mitotic-specific cyclin-B3 n=1 Tax=Erinaceus europaeus TaxID=9365 RepID=A0ABM3WSM0_ERIEU|nr:G2/mitotic-specific cyclin-B3 [Erinaceus europaeus]
MELVKDISKRLSNTIPASVLTRSNEVNTNRYKVETLPLVTSTTMTTNVEKPCILEPSTSSKTQTTQETSIFKKSLVSKRNPTILDTLLTKKLLSLRKSTSQEEVSLLDKPLSLQKETNLDADVIIEPVNLESKQRTEETTITGKIPSLNKMPTDQRKQGLLQDINIEADSAPVNFDKEPKTEKTIFTKKLLSFRKCATQVNISDMNKSPQKVTSVEKSPVKELLSSKRKPIPKSIFQQPSLFQESPTTWEEAAMLKKPQPLQEIKTSGYDFLRQQMFFRKTQDTKEVTKLPLENECPIQEKTFHLRKPIILQKPTIGQKLLMGQQKEVVSHKRKCTTEESLSQDPFAWLENHTTQEITSTVKKPSDELQQGSPTEENSLFKKDLTFTKKRTIEETTSTNNLLSSKKKCTPQCKLSHLKPLILQTTSKEKSLIKEPLPFKMKLTTEEGSLFNVSAASQEKHTIQGKVALYNPWALQKNIGNGSEPLMEPFEFKMKYTTNEADSTKEPVTLKKRKSDTQMKSVSQDLLHLKDNVDEDKNSFFMGSPSFRKSPPTKQAILAKAPLSLSNPKTQDTMFFFKKITSGDESHFKDALPYRKEPTTEKGSFLQDSSVKKERYMNLERVLLPKNSLALQKKVPSEEGSYIKESLNLNEKPAAENKSLSQELLSSHINPGKMDEALFWKALALQKKNNTKENLKNVVSSQEGTTEEKSLSMKPPILKLSAEVPKSTERQLGLTKKPTDQSGANSYFLKNQLSMQDNITMEVEFLIKKLVAMQENLKIEKENHVKKSVNVQEKDGTENETIMKQPLTLQQKCTAEDNVFLNKLLALQKPSSGREPLVFPKPIINQAPLFTTANVLSFKEILNFQKNPTHKEDTSLSKVLIPQVQTSACLSSAVSKPATSMSRATTISSVGSFSSFRKPFTSESNSSKLSSKNKKSREERITSLKAADDNEYDDSFYDSVYTKDIFMYMKEREHKFMVKSYMNWQTEINAHMRSLLIDWLVEVQISFEMSHESLYLAVKLLDHYLMKVIGKKDELQLLGSTAFLIAAKFEEPYPISVEDCLYICDDHYQKKELLTMEANMLKMLNFDIGIPTSYHFLRKYAQCIHVDMVTITLSRYICERTLQEYDYVKERPSKLAAASFLLALYMKKLHHWTASLEYYSGYKSLELHPLVRQMNSMLTANFEDKLGAVHSKYSHRAYFEVTKIPPLSLLKLEEILKYS